MTRFDQKVPQQRLSSGFIQAYHVDTTHKKLLALIHVDVEKRQLLLVVECSVRNARVVDVAKLAVSLFQILKARCNFFAAENLTVLDREKRAQSLDVANCPVVLERDPAQVVLQAFVYVDAKYDPLTDGSAS